MGANTRLDRLSDYERHRANVLIVCGCGHRSVLDAGKLRRWYFCHRWNDSIEVLGLHLRCSVCLGRPAMIRATSEKPDRPKWMALESDWKRLVKRLRGSPGSARVGGGCGRSGGVDGQTSGGSLGFVDPD